MDDNIDSSPDTAAFSDGYKAGWKARGEYIQDFHKSISGTSLGIGLMVLSAVVVAGVLATALTIPFATFNIAVAIQTLLVATGIGVAGYFIDRAETKSYKKRQAEFKAKWGD
jgi:hypothetical protein